MKVIQLATEKAVAPSGTARQVHTKLNLAWVLLGISFSVSFPGFPGHLPLGLFFIVAIQPFLIKERWTTRESLVVLALTISTVGYIFSLVGHGHSPATRQLSAFFVFGVLLWSLGRMKDAGNLKKRSILIGFCAGWIIQSIVRPAGYAATDLAFLWKYSIAVPVTLIVLLMLWRKAGTWGYSAVALSLLGTISLFANFRSHGAICLVLAGVLFAVLVPRIMNLSGFPRYAAQGVALLASLAPLAFIPRLVKDGFFGTEIQRKSAQQGEMGPWFLAGRTEPAMSYAAISERPLWGWGSVADVPGSVVREGVQVLLSFGLKDASATVNGWYRHGDQVTLHSVLAQYWVEAGAMAVVFFLFILVAIFRGMAQSHLVWRPVIMYFGLQFVWDLLFSPYTAELIVLWGLMFATLLSVQSPMRVRSAPQRHVH